ncbi:hypothetical protein GALMADRAFT_1048477 [Galerina marginata CBS 339.88]|uniref:Yeast cell wall synthesis Kre9/Knh1-like N-terminal domain-containing protein n=1 Tax=Galerina marginata (strain CBS 339.88) TaxID=685588 RepID=A0A067SBB9_GALM3|nr:hypothetical protein GALMADRAFT_1048477 [Galerina marginata CBS 339.88]
MLFAISLLAAITPLVASFGFIVPNHIPTGSELTIGWSFTPADPPVFSLFLVNLFPSQTFVLARNIDTTTGQITLTLPLAPVGDMYIFEAVRPDDDSDLFATAGTIHIGPGSSSLTKTGTSTALPTSQP